MLGGYTGRFLWVDLQTGQLREEIPDERLLIDFIGGYGVAARLIYERQRPGIGPLDPESVFALLTGPLTGSPAPTGTRWTAAAKSPLTGTWGDSNASGYFGHALKASGYDAVFFTGAAERPVFLFLDDGKAELRPAAHLWGMDTYQVEDWVKAELGSDAEAACIGPAGEQRGLISAVIHAKGRAAGRGGMGAVMGSKHLKAVVARGQRPVEVADRAAVARLRKKYTQQIMRGVGSADFYRSTGTPGYITTGVRLGDSPTRNWGGVGPRDFLAQVERIGYQAIEELGKKRRACWRCPIACWGELRLHTEGETLYAHVPEYETAAAFGSNLLNADLLSIVKANEICNRMGLDTMSAGATVAFALECYEHGLIDKSQTDGMSLSWGDPAAIVEVLEKLARREPGLGELLADGVRAAARRIGSAAEAYAIHICGQELPMHDPRYEPGLGLIYRVDATPGRHTQGCQWFWPEGLPIDGPSFGEERDKQHGRGRTLRPLISLTHVMNASGICLFGYLSTRAEMLPEFLSAVTGHEYSMDDLLLIGERIACMRQAFNIREGVNVATASIPARAYGIPPLEEGPTAGFTVDIQTLQEDYLDAMEWTRDSAVPTARKLRSLGLDDVAEDLW
jgi:aldehyde:ferredoxin oxidoreductase